MHRRDDRGAVILAWRRFGPYHYARARAASQILPLVGLEISPIDHVNLWAPIEHEADFRLLTVFGSEDPKRMQPATLSARIADALDNVDPEVIVVHGYADREALMLMQWAVGRGRQLVLMSESNAYDAARLAPREWIKRRVIRLCSSALVGGSDARRYLTELGMPSDRVFLGYDAVDNEHFCRDNGVVAIAPQGPGASRRFFLASARFISSKNHEGLLEAYAAYRRRAADVAWDLVVLGNGILRQEIEARRRDLGIAGHVILPGFKQYEELPSWYAAASCFVHPSTTEQWGLVVNEAMAAGLPVLVSRRCGCAADLVEEGVNGFTFEPHDTRGLAELMYRMAHGAVDREAMGQASRRIIADWGPERFADGLVRAVEAALSAAPPKATLLDKALLWALTRR